MTLTTQELTDMRATAAEWLPDTCTISTPTASVDSTGSPIETFADTYTGVACRKEPAGGDETVRNLGLEASAVWWLWLAYDQDIDPTYRVTHGGNVHQVKMVEDDHSYTIARRALIVRVG